MFRSLVNLRVLTNIINGHHKRGLLLRKLDEKERSILIRRFDESYVFKVKITSRIDLFEVENLKHLKESIVLWKHSHPFLNCRINVADNSEYYFDIDEIETSTNDLKNVNFLRFEGQLDRDRQYGDVSDLVLYKHLAQPIRLDQSQLSSTDLLWRLSIVQLSSQFEYDVMFDVHHTIAQARNSYLTIMQLFQVFEDLYKHREPSLKTSELYLGAETVFNRIRQQQISHEPNIIPVIKIPHFMRSNQTIQTQMSDFDYSKTINGHLVDVESGLEYDSIKNLYEIKQKYHRRHRTFFLDEHLFSRLLKKCKKEDVRFGMFIQMIIARSLIDLYEKHGNLDELKNIVYYAPVCLRRHCNLNEYVMGYCVGGMISVLDATDIDDLLENKERFWLAARRSGEIYQNRLENEKEKFFLRMREIDEGSGEVNFHFSTSNMMSFEKNEATKDGTIRARECFWISSGVPEKNNRLFLSTFCTLDRKINWMIVFNSTFIREDLIDEIIQLIQHHINTILID